MNRILLRAQLTASAVAPPDAITFAGLIGDRAADLNRIFRDVIFAEARGNIPGEGTLQALEAVGRDVLQAAHHWRTQGRE